MFIWEMFQFGGSKKKTLPGPEWPEPSAAFTRLKRNGGRSSVTKSGTSKGLRLQGQPGRVSCRVWQVGLCLEKLKSWMSFASENWQRYTKDTSSCTMELLFRDLLLCCHCAMRERETASPEASTLPGRAQLPALRNGPKQLETLKNHKGHLGDHVSPASPAIWNWQLSSQYDTSVYVIHVYIIWIVFLSVTVCILYNNLYITIYTYICNINQYFLRWIRQVPSTEYW